MTTIAAEVSRKLKELGGEPPFKSQLQRIKSALSWRDKAAENRIRHLVKGEQQPTPSQVDQIRVAHARLVVAKLRGRSKEDEKLFSSLREFLHLAEASDPDYFLPAVKEIGDLVHSIVYPPRSVSGVDRKQNTSD